jgi:beta-phosphoglucomutase-like phosphatase (HAD superfamily)
VRACHGFSFLLTDLLTEQRRAGRPAGKTGGRGGGQIPHCARYLLALPITVEDYLREREVLFRTLMPTAQAMPGARELTAALRARGVPVVVATSSAQPVY